MENQDKHLDTEDTGNTMNNLDEHLDIKEQSEDTSVAEQNVKQEDSESEDPYKENQYNESEDEIKPDPGSEELQDNDIIKEEGMDEDVNDTEQFEATEPNEQQDEAPQEEEMEGQEKDIDDDLFKLKRYKKPSTDDNGSKSTQKPRLKKTRSEGISQGDTGTKRSRPESDNENEQEDGMMDADFADRADNNGENPNGDPADSDFDPNMDEATRRRKLLKKKIQEHGAKPKKKSRKANDESLDVFQDELINQLREDMRKAAIADAECIKNSQPAINKLKMLPRVTSVLRKGALADTILDNNLLESIRIWLEPLPDASLPAYQIQKELFEALETLPIKTIHLRESGLGRVVLFYKQSIRPQLNIRRTVDRLMGNWTRPIMGRSDNYRDKIIRTSSYNVREDTAYRSRGNISNSSYSQQDGKASSDLAAVNAQRRNRALIPTAKPVYYEVAPKSIVTNASASQGKAVNESYKRMTNKLLGKKKPSARKSGVSLEGR